MLFESVKKRLEGFGVTISDNDIWMINFCIEKTENHIKNTCNVLEVPLGLFNVACDMAVGEFLLIKMQTGQLEVSDLDFSAAISQLREGEVSIEFAKGSSDQEKFDSLVNYLLTKGEGDLISYRRIKW